MALFEIRHTDIDGVVVLTPKVFGDRRGYFMETFSQREFNRLVCNVTFVQDNESSSTRGVLRGLHFQKPPYAQAKLVRCTRGAVLDVAVDIRKGSPTYGHHVAEVLSEENRRQLYIPQGFAHGFAVLSDVAVFQYKCSEFYHPEAEGGIDLYSSDLAIDWQISEHEAILSDKDSLYPAFSDFITPFDYHAEK
ncbi:MAG: dTDP-4-dehydrorhamnose 3,5-epimerase [Muribaculaceae bacterium]|nr:dTDP-4-dehydrorhamnose 3,5-epimerase [Muribaculaceae bacterium]